MATTTNSSTFTFPSVQDTLNHPAFPSTIWALEPHKKGILPCAKNRGGPVNISWEIHGTGPIKLLLIMGLAGMGCSWQRQTQYFGHDRSHQFSVLVFDNRGIGFSDKPLTRYSTSEMAQDTIELLNHVGWTSLPRQVHVAGISLGGMIAQEIACAIPSRIASLSLLCTTAHFSNEASAAAATSLKGWVNDRIGFLMPRSEGDTILHNAKKLFTHEFLSAPDGQILPDPSSTPMCGPASSSPDGSYARFDSNFQRFQAQELTKRRRPGCFTIQGFLCQLVAAGWHRKSDEQLRAMADEVGRERILVMHGTRDEMITPGNGRRLMDVIRPGSVVMEEGVGHAPILERAEWFNELMEEKFRGWSELN